MAAICHFGPANAADVRGFGIFKNQDFVQASTNTPVLQTNYPAFSFSAIVQPNGVWTGQVVSASVESPPFGFVDTLWSPTGGSDEPFAYSFPRFSQADVDVSYPVGSYTLRITTAHDGNKTLQLSLRTNQFPAAAPRVANFSDAQAIDVVNDFAVRWDAFTGGTTNDSVAFSLADSNGAVVLRSAAFGAEAGRVQLTGTNTSIVIPAGTLEAGRDYFGYLIFEKDVAVNTNYTGAIGLVGFSKSTSFTLHTVGAPWLETVGVTGSQFVLRVHGGANASYVVQRTANVAVPVWTSIYTNAGTFEVNDPLMTGSGQRFYRAVRLPTVP